MSMRPDPEGLPRLLALVVEALELSDAHALHATGIALDAARLSVEEAIGATLPDHDDDAWRQDGSIRNGAIRRGRG